MSDPLRDMRRGDRGALQVFLRTHGRSIEALREALDSAIPLEECAITVWRSSLSALGPVDARGHALAAIVRCLVGNDRESGPNPEVDLPAFTVAAAYVHQGIGSDRERGYLERALKNEPSLAELQAKICTALDVANRAPKTDTKTFDALWPKIEPQLR